jgi:excisionase family DNA binding protein
VTEETRRPFGRTSVQSRITMQPLLAAYEVAELLRLPVREVYKLAAGGALPGVRIGRRLRWEQSEVASLIQRGRTTPAASGSGAE